jgi:hypothetical protein
MTFYAAMLFVLGGCTLIAWIDRSKRPVLAKLEANPNLLDDPEE